MLVLPLRAWAFGPRKKNEVFFTLSGLAQSSRNLSAISAICRRVRAPPLAAMKSVDTARSRSGCRRSGSRPARSAPFVAVHQGAYVLRLSPLRRSVHRLSSRRLYSHPFSSVRGRSSRRVVALSLVAPSLRTPALVAPALVALPSPNRDRLTRRVVAPTSTAPLVLASAIHNSAILAPAIKCSLLNHGSRRHRRRRRLPDVRLVPLCALAMDSPVDSIAACLCTRTSCVDR